MDNAYELKLADLWPAMEEQLNNGKTVRFQPQGTSMLPMLRPGVDTVLLKKAPDMLKKNDLPLYKRADGHFVLHRIVSVKSGTYVMCGDNQWRLEYNILPEQILAVTQGFYRGERYISCNNIFYRIYCAIRTDVLKMRIFASRMKRKIKKILHF